jgi:hypothetical protein
VSEEQLGVVLKSVRRRCTYRGSGVKLRDGDILVSRRQACQKSNASIKRERVRMNRMMMLKFALAANA